MQPRSCSPSVQYSKFQCHEAGAERRRGGPSSWESLSIRADSFSMHFSIDPLLCAYHPKSGRHGGAKGMKATVHLYINNHVQCMYTARSIRQYSGRKISVVATAQQNSTLTPSGTPGTRAKLFTIKYQTMPDRMSMEQNLRPMFLFGDLYIGPRFTASAWAEQGNYGSSCSIDRGIYCPSTRKSVGLSY